MSHSQSKSRPVSNKAANLIALREIGGICVKPLECLSAQEVQGILADNLEGRNALNHLHQAINSWKLDDASFAVRSAVEGEDGGQRSSAGQFQTLLRITRAALPEAIRACATSASSEAAQAYALEHGITYGEFEVIVQAMVDAVASGVFFSIDPHLPCQAIIEVVHGTSEAYMDGSVKPRRYCLDPETGDTMAEEGEPTPIMQQETVRRLFAIAQRIKRHFNYEVDIEWAIDRDGVIWINQVRPITAMTDPLETSMVRAKAIRLTEREVRKERGRLADMTGREISSDVLSNQNIGELLPRPTHMAFHLFTGLFGGTSGAVIRGRKNMGYEIGAEAANLYRLVGGKAYCSITADAMTYRVAGMPLEDYVRLVDRYLQEIRADPRRANYPEVGLYRQEPSEEFLRGLFGRSKARQYRVLYEQFFRRIKMVEYELAGSALGRFVPAWSQTLASLAPTERSTLGYIECYRSAMRILREQACVDFVKVARLGFFSFARVQRLLEKDMGAEAAREGMNELAQGIDPHLNPNLKFDMALDGLRCGTQRLEEVVRDFGHWAPTQLEISVPRYADNPQLLLDQAQKVPRDPEAQFMRSAHKSMERERAFASRSSNRTAFTEAVRLARRYLSLRELVKYEYLRGYRVMRTCAAELNRFLGWEDGLIFHLSPEELFQLEHWQQRSRLHHLALSRKAEWHVQENLEVPGVLFAENLSVIGREDTQEGQTLRGIGVTNVVHTGPAVVLLDLSDRATFSMLKPGVVLVTKTTDPGWSGALSALGTHGGLVTEIGGMVAHGATCVREKRGVAAVLNVPGATRRIQNGMRVRVDGPAQTVTILD